MINIDLIAGVFGEGYQPSTWQELYNRIIALTTAEAAVDETFIMSQSAPGPEDQGKVWIRVTAANAIDRLYTYVSGQWVAPHPIAPGDPMRRIYTGTVDDLVTYDGGASGAVHDASGPMWVEDVNFRYRFPLGAGPTQVDAGIIVAPGDSGGEQVHTLTGAESGTSAHVHHFGTDRFNGGPDDGAGVPSGGAGPGVDTQAATEANALSAHNNMPPYQTVLYVKRSGRKYYLPG